MSERFAKSIAVLNTHAADHAAHIAGLFDALRATRATSVADVEVRVVDVRCSPRMDPTTDDIARKFALFDAISALDARSTDAVLIPDLACYGFVAELAAVSPIRVGDIAQALIEHVSTRYPSVRRIALLTNESPERLAPFVERLADCGLAVTCVPAEGAASANPDGAELIVASCHALLDAAHRSARTVPVLDIERLYAGHALDAPRARRNASFKLGVLGGVGPAATVSFLDKLVRATPATRDQDHLKVVIEQNPQIPDRTDHLVNGGPDPTLALFATCRRLQQADADAIAIPCNTAHAFVERIQSALAIPIVHMLKETIDFIASAWPQVRTIGLLATDGTLQSRVYHREAEAAGLAVVSPAVGMQQSVMAAIYGPDGVKAGRVAPLNQQAILRAIVHLADLGADAVILGCTELPLLVAQDLGFEVNGRVVPLVDPADVLARRCVELAFAGTPREPLATAGTIGFDAAI
jgi:aspartate racemase